MGSSFKTVQRSLSLIQPDLWELPELSRFQTGDMQAMEVHSFELVESFIPTTSLVFLLSNRSWRLVDCQKCQVEKKMR
jgi:hypothetical protein